MAGRIKSREICEYLRIEGGGVKDCEAVVPEDR